MNELRWIEWNEWIEGFDFVNPMGMVPMVERDEPYESDLVDLNEKVPIKMNGIDEIWMNWVKWGEMSELKDLTWNNPMGISLWVGWECPYGSDLNEPYEKVPIKMIRFDEIWMNWGE